MKQKAGFFLLVLLMAALLPGCSMQKAGKDKVRDLEYTVVPDEDIPEELKTIIEEKKKQPFEFSYAAGDALYISLGYGEQKTGGYSIVVDELYATDTSVVFSASLLGPGKDEKVEETPTFPYIVIKTEYLDLNVEYAGIENRFFD